MYILTSANLNEVLCESASISSIMHWASIHLQANGAQLAVSTACGSRIVMLDAAGAGWSLYRGEWASETYEFNWYRSAAV